MRRAIPPPTLAETVRINRAMTIGCVCCHLNLEREDYQVAPSYPTVQHCNVGGKHGAPNRGQRFTYVACAWHHLGTPPAGLQAREAALLYGPSFHHQARAFRQHYGSDDALILLTDQLTGFQPCATAD